MGVAPALKKNKNHPKKSGEKKKKEASHGEDIGGGKNSSATAQVVSTRINDFPGFRKGRATNTGEQSSGEKEDSGKLKENHRRMSLMQPAEKLDCLCA